VSKAQSGKVVKKKKPRPILAGVLALSVGALIYLILFSPPGYTRAQRAYFSLTAMDDTEQAARDRLGPPLRDYTDSEGLHVLVYQAKNGVEVALRFDPQTGEKCGGSIRPDP